MLRDPAATPRRANARLQVYVCLVLKEHIDVVLIEFFEQSFILNQQI